MADCVAEQARVAPLSAGPEWAKKASELNRPLLALLKKVSKEGNRHIERVLSIVDDHLRACSECVWTGVRLEDMGRRECISWMLRPMSEGA